MKKSVVVVGGINIDIKAKSFDKLVDGSSNPGSIKVAPGGVGRNIAHNLALLGVDVTFISAIGKNDEGENILKQTAAAGVNVEHVLRLDNQRTGTYLALLDNSGEMALALSDMQIQECLTEDLLKEKLDVISQADYIICDTNIPQKTLEYIIVKSKVWNIPICIEPVSVAKAAKAKELLEGVDLITPNRDELAALADCNETSTDMETAAKTLLEKGVKNILVTLGKEGICLINSDGVSCYGSYPALVADVTGAGDSLTAGLIYGLFHYGNWNDACKSGLAAAAITVASKDTVSSDMNPVNLQRIINTKGEEC